MESKVPENERLKVERFNGRMFVDCEFGDLQSGDLFKLSDPNTGVYCIGEGHIVFRAKSDPYVDDDTGVLAVHATF